MRLRFAPLGVYRIPSQHHLLLASLLTTVAVLPVMSSVVSAGGACLSKTKFKSLERQFDNYKNNDPPDKDSFANHFRTVVDKKVYVITDPIFLAGIDQDNNRFGTDVTVSAGQMVTGVRDPDTGASCVGGGWRIV